MERSVVEQLSLVFAQTSMGGDLTSALPFLVILGIVFLIFYGPAIFVLWAVIRRCPRVVSYLAIAAAVIFHVLEFAFRIKHDPSFFLGWLSLSLLTIPLVACSLLRLLRGSRASTGATSSV